jgi:predicted DNA-binding protein
MSVLSVRLPQSLHERLRQLSKKENISINQFILWAVAEKVGTLDAMDYLAGRAARGDREKLLAVLDKAPDVEPEDYDKL